MVMRNVALTGATVGTAMVAALPLADVHWTQVLLPIESALLAVLIEWLRRKMSPPPAAPDKLDHLERRLGRIEDVLESLDSRPKPPT